MITKMPAAIPVTPQNALPAANAQAAQPNDSEVSSVTKIKWKALSDISVHLSTGRKILHRVERQSQQSCKKEHSEAEQRIN